MNLEALCSAYILCDGKVHSFQLNLDYLSTNESKRANAQISLGVRKKVAKNKFESCIIELDFEGISEIRLCENFKSSIDYSDITFNKLENGLFYFSIDPFGNTNEPHANDNFVLVAQSFRVMEKKKTIL